ncbi:anti-phage defense ZorAB system ZorA [bacterium]|nr:anti-phage defense ZorAB system ZorA [bacterium]
MSSFIDFLIQAKESPITFWFSVVIGAYFLFELFRHLLFKVLPIKIHFDKATKVLNSRVSEGRKGGDAPPPVIKGRDLFPRSGKLAQLWTHFSTAWFKSVPKGGCDIGSVDIHSFFTMDESIGDHSYLRKLESIPGRLLSLGILGTFVGLAYGVSGISGASAGDSDKMMTEVLGLVSGLSIAFFTSIFGILCSLLFQFGEKSLVGRATFSLLVFRRSVKALYPVLEPENALVKISDFAGQQADSLRTLENDLAATLSESFGGAIQEHLTPLIEQIRESVSQATDSSSQLQLDGISKIIDGFLDGMQEQMGNNFQKLGSDIQNASMNLGELSSRLEAATKSQADIMEQTAQTAEVLERQLPAMLAFGDKLDRGAGQFREAIEAISLLEQGMAEGTRKLVKIQAESEGRLSEILNRLEESSKLVDSTAATQNESQIRMEKAYKEALESFEHGVRDGLIQSLTTFDSVLSDILQRFSGTLADMKEQYDHLSKHSQALKEGVELASTKIAENLVDVGVASTQAHLRIKELSESYLENTSQGIAASTDAIKHMRNAASEIALHLPRIQEGVEKLAIKLDEVTKDEDSSASRGFLSRLRGGR